MEFGHESLFLVMFMMNIAIANFLSMLIRIMALQKKLYDAKTNNEIINITCDELKKSVMKGRIFKSLDEIEASTGLEYELYPKLATYCFNQRRVAAIATPPPNIQELINTGEPKVLRDILVAVGYGNISINDSYELGKFICRNLPYKNRRKIEVMRFSEKISVNLYTCNEFADIAFLIGYWKKYVNC